MSEIVLGVGLQLTPFAVRHGIPRMVHQDVIENMVLLHFEDPIFTRCSRFSRYSTVLNFNSSL